jgi:L-cysteate sulfo-lyase
MIAQVKEGYFDGMNDVVFLHTGGSAALFGYSDTFDLHGYTD